MTGLIVLGFLGILLCIVMVIVSAIKKNHKVKFWGLGIVASLIIMIIGAANSPSTTAVQKVSPETTKAVSAETTIKSDASKATTQATTAVPKSSENKIGDSVKSGKAIFTVNSVREIEPTEFIKPADGSIYYAVDVTIENTGSKSLAASSLLMFKIVDSDSYSYTITIGPEIKGQLDGEIAAGRKLRGELAFEIPKTSKGLELEIDPSVWSFGDKIIYKLDR